MPKLIASVIDDLQTTTDRLFTESARMDMDQIEFAVAARERAVRKLSDLVSQSPESFTPQHLEQVRHVHSRGKQAIEKLIQTRRDGWTTATELKHNQHVLKSFTRFRTPPE